MTVVASYSAVPFMLTVVPKGITKSTMLPLHPISFAHSMATCVKKEVAGCLICKGFIEAHRVRRKVGTRHLCRTESSTVFGYCLTVFKYLYIPSPCLSACKCVAPVLHNVKPKWLLPLCASRIKSPGIPPSLSWDANGKGRGRTLTGSAALLELVPNASTSALEKPRATSKGFRLLMNQKATGRITIPKITNPARK